MRPYTVYVEDFWPERRRIESGRRYSQKPEGYVGFSGNVGCGGAQATSVTLGATDNSKG